MFIFLDFLDTPFLNNLALESDTEGFQVDSHEFSTEAAKRLKPENSYYQTSNLKTTAVPTSCNSKYETSRGIGKVKESKHKSFSSKKSSLPRNIHKTKTKCVKKPSKSQNKEKELKRIFSERTLNTITRPKPSNRSKIAKLDLYSHILEGKSISQFTKHKYSPNKLSNRTRNVIEMGNSQNIDMKTMTQKSQNKLITSLKNKPFECKSPPLQKSKISTLSK